MTTSSNTTTVLHTTDAEFRTWLTEFSGMLTAAGFPKSADTGQVNTATVTLGSTNTYAGYEIRYLNDSLHATKPIYVKIEYGTQANAGRPMIRISAASSTNGAGTLSGTTYLSIQVLLQNAPLSTAATWFSGACALEGYAAFVFKRGFYSYGSAFFAVCRTADSSGTPTATGFSFYYSVLNNVYRSTYVSSALLDQTGFCLFPGADTITLVSGSPQVMRHFQYTPQIQCVPHLLSYINTEIGDMSTFTATPVGATQRTYLALGGTVGPTSAGQCGGASTILTTARLAIQWE